MSHRIVEVHQAIQEYLPMSLGIKSQKDYIEARRVLLALSKLSAEIRKELLAESKQVKEQKKQKKKAPIQEPTAPPSSENDEDTPEERPDGYAQEPSPKKKKKILEPGVIVKTRRGRPKKK